MSLVKCSQNDFEWLYGSVMEYVTDYFYRKGSVKRMWNQLELGREMKAEAYAENANNYWYLGNLVYAMLVWRRLYGGPWTDYIDPETLKCIVESFQCAGVDIKPFLRQFGIDPYAPSVGGEIDYLDCPDVGIGELIIQDPICPWTIR